MLGTAGNGSTYRVIYDQNLHHPIPISELWHTAVKQLGSIVQRAWKCTALIVHTTLMHSATMHIEVAWTLECAKLLNFQEEARWKPGGFLALQYK